MDKKTEALRLALEALTWTEAWRPEGLKEQAITAIREALAEQPAQQEPAFWMDTLDVERKTPTVISNFGKHEGDPAAEKCVYPVWTSPQPSKPWVGLTDEDFNTNMFSITSLGNCDIESIKSIAKDVEDKLREKNA